MNKKAFMISGSGLKNVIFTLNDYEDNFKFILNKQEININRFYADFISPTVSHIHQVDPTINYLCLNDTIQKLNISDEIINTEVLNNIKQMASGYPIEIDENMCHKIRLFSFLLGNDEIFQQMNELFPITIEEETNIDSCLQYLYYSQFSNNYQNQALLDFISSHFYLIEKSKIEKMPKSIIYSIISNEHLKISDENSLFELIDHIFENDNQENDDNFYKNKIIFYEQISIEELNEENFQKLIDSIDSNQMTQFLWSKLKKCFYYQFLKNKDNENNDRYLFEKIKKIEYDNNSNNRFNGIIFYLGNGNPKSVVDNQIVDVTCSSILRNDSSYDPKNAVDFNQNNASFLSDDVPNSWLLYDFKDKKIKPSSYSIKSHHFNGKGCYHPQTWVIEGSNDKNDWKILDSRKEEKSLDDQSVSNNFKIQNKLGKNDYYRYLRIKQTGVTTRNDNYFSFSSLEYFGSIIKQ